jgi:hypothetical protein
MLSLGVLSRRPNSMDLSGQYCKESNGSIELLVRLESLCRDLRLKRRWHVIGDVYAC